METKSVLSLLSFIELGRQFNQKTELGDGDEASVVSNSEGGAL